MIAGPETHSQSATPLHDVQVQRRCDVLADPAFLHGLAAQALEAVELNDHDPGLEVVITLRVASGGDA